MASKVESLIQEFVVNLRAAIAEEAAQAFIIAGGGALKGKPGPKPRGVASSTPKTTASKRTGGKRTAEEIEAQGATILTYLKKNPSSGAEQIGAALGMKTAELALPIAKLLEQKSLKHVGQRRGRKYSAK
jgi:hypothetical protein